tara:strand:- start:2493 stop:3356 length:864 start_codon:yes stop_codon:yes gene_type:complete
MVGTFKEQQQMTVLICGSTGRLGRSVTSFFRKQTTVVAPTRNEIDFTSKEALRDLIEAEKPVTVINCAAWTDVDGCEKNPELAKKLNTDLPQHLSELIENIDSHLIQISTDFVFDGQTDKPYNEEHLPNPISIYGQTKLEGEKAAGPDATVIRTSWLQAPDELNMVKGILEGFKKAGPLELPNDRQANPTFIEDLLPIIKCFAESRFRGVVHATNEGTTNWCEFAKFIAEKTNNDPTRITPSEPRTLNRVAARPAFSALDNEVIRREKIQPIRHHHDAVLEILNKVN